MTFFTGYQVGWYLGDSMKRMKSGLVVISKFMASSEFLQLFIAFFYCLFKYPRLRHHVIIQCKLSGRTVNWMMKRTPKNPKERRRVISWKFDCRSTWTFLGILCSLVADLKIRSLQRRCEVWGRQYVCQTFSHTKTPVHLYTMYVPNFERSFDVIQKDRQPLQREKCGSSTAAYP